MENERPLPDKLNENTPANNEPSAEYLETIISNRPVTEMSEAEKKAERKLIRDRLKALNASPRSDYHREFEDAVQLTIEAWNVGAWTIREHELGEDPPRTDLIVVTGNGLPDNVEEVFSFFLLHNALEFKGPGDALDQNTLRKVAGYGHFLIATAKKEENIKSDNVTLSIFASEVNVTEFAEMTNDGTLTSTSTPGVYTVNGLTDLPFQVVIIGELEGEAYAAYRVLRKHAEISDVVLLLDKLKKSDEEHDQNRMDRLHRILDLVEKKNPGAVADKIEELKNMKSVFMDVLKPEIDEEINAAVTTAVDNTTRTIYFTLVQDGDLTVERAAQKTGISVDQFQTQMNEYVRSQNANNAAVASN